MYVYGMNNRGGEKLGDDARRYVPLKRKSRVYGNVTDDVVMRNYQKLV